MKQELNTDNTNNNIDEGTFKNDNEIIKRLKEINDKLDSFDIDPDPDIDPDSKKSNQKNTIIALIILIIIGGILFFSKGKINVNNQ